MLKDKNILVTGGSGSVGRALVEELLKQRPGVVRIFDTNESAEFEMRQEIKDEAGITRYLIGDVRDFHRLERAMEGIDVVFHCAGLKHVLSSEYNPFEAVKTNILGTQNVIDAALNNNVEKVIFTSSDKAVNPSNVMGATKLVSEKLMTAANYYKGHRRTVLASVRFGNVLWSSGSVLPLFKSQINNHGFITVTDPNMTRFIMSKKETVRLIFKAAESAKGGELFILKMPVVRIGDLAAAVVDEFGKGKVEVKYIGALPGEKMYEELMTADEAEKAFETDDMFVILPLMKDLADGAGINPNSIKKAEKRPYSSIGATPLSREEIRKIIRN